jgi:hypothetical protein
MDYNLKFSIEDVSDKNLYSATKTKITRNNRDRIFGEYFETVYYWRLSKYLHQYDGDLRFSYKRTASEVGILTYEVILRELNTNYCFDFDYEPAQGDYLTIVFKYKTPETKSNRRPLIEQWICFKFINDKWIFERYYDDILEEIHRGILHVESK